MVTSSLPLTEPNLPESNGGMMGYGEFLGGGLQACRLPQVVGMGWGEAYRPGLYPRWV